MAKQAKSTKSSGGDKFTRWLVIGMVTLVVASGAIFSIVGEKTKANESFAILNDFKVGPTLVSTVDEANGSGITFNNGAAKTVDIWEDPQCPVCKTFEQANGEFIDELVRTKKANVVYHVVSFLGNESVAAANAAYCAADEGRYLDFHKALYLVQPVLENSGFFSRENLIKIGSYAGLKSQSFSDCVTKGSKLDKVKAAYESMAKYNVQGTPTVFFNGKKWERQNNAFLPSEFAAAFEAS
ncbi:MAG: protein-disulfide isomerase [Actinobacteria bacterium]|jgi:protein-disulfide isomerase|nr:protein-disulfide isomerase [Actinomycetota bacterium]NCX52587.1 protein-disulfide isomerase [Actinomycetota bacterium]